MKQLKHIWAASVVMFLAVCLTACKHEVNDIPRVKEEMELSASSENVALDDNNPGKDIVTFNWKKARPQSDDHMITYTTKLDVVGNNFGSSTAILTYEDDGVFSKSFTSEQLQNWATQKWKIPANKNFTLEFRVVAQWEGGATFEAPEVRTIKINVTPIKAVAFEVDKVFAAGSAIPGNAKKELPKTLENLNQYALVLNLQPGELQIPVEYNGATNYVAAADGGTAIKDGAPMSIRMREVSSAWKIETAGQYRVVINMQKATATIYSPAQPLTPKVVQWTAANNVPMETTVAELWMHGSINDWGTPIKMECKVSQADPQVLVYTGGRVGKAKFIVYGGSDNNKNLAYAFSCPLTAAGAQQELALVLGKSAELSGGSTSAQRNSYYTIPSGANTVVFDLRNMTVVAEKR